MRSPHRVPLVNEPTFLKFCQPEGQDLTALNRDHGTMMRLAQSEAFGFNSALVLDLYNFSPLGRAAIAARISVGKRVSRIIKFHQVKIGNTGIVNRVSPTLILVVAD